MTTQRRPIRPEDLVALGGGNEPEEWQIERFERLVPATQLDQM
jgi:hypothetical protein